MVKILSPAYLKSVKGRLVILWKSLMAEIAKKEFFDTDKVVVIALKKKESVAFVDRNDDLWELFRNRKGRYVVKRLRDRRGDRVG
jgi:hypothetical protein